MVTSETATSEILVQRHKARRDTRGIAAYTQRDRFTLERGFPDCAFVCVIGEKTRVCC
jgi:hypothetical protein